MFRKGFSKRASLSTVATYSLSTGLFHHFKKYTHLKSQTFPMRLFSSQPITSSCIDADRAEGQNNTPVKEEITQLGAYSSTIDKTAFLKASSIIRQSILNFLHDIKQIERNHGPQHALFDEVIDESHYILNDLPTWENKQNASIYDYYIDGILTTLLQHKEKIEAQLPALSFAPEIKKALLSLDELFWQKPVERGISHPLPSIMHRIWFGSSLPDRYKDYLLNFKKHHPHFRLVLWTDFAGLSPEQIADFNQFCSDNHIDLKNIREHADLLNYALIEKELDHGIFHDTENARVHFVRASDLARISILFKWGGLYSDTDTNCHYLLPTINLDFGLTIKSVINGAGIKNNKLQFNTVGYDFIGALPGNKLLALCADLFKVDYDTYTQSKETTWQSSKTHGIHLDSTIALTGSALIVVLSYLIENNPQDISQFKSLFIAAETYMPSAYDKSWLDHLDQSKEEDEEKSTVEFSSLQSFIQEINLRRYTYLNENKHQFSLASLKPPPSISHETAETLNHCHGKFSSRL